MRRDLLVRSENFGGSWAISEVWLDEYTEAGDLVYREQLDHSLSDVELHALEHASRLMFHFGQLQLF